MDLCDVTGLNERNMEPGEYWHKTIQILGGPEAFEPYLPFDLPTLAKQYTQDPHFNQHSGGNFASPLSVWDKAAGFQITKHPAQPPTYEPNGTGLWELLHKYHVTWMSLSQSVCLLKYAACELLELRGYINPANPAKKTNAHE